MYDLNDVEPAHGGDPIPDGSFAKVTMAIKPGNTDGQTEIDKGLLKASNSPGSDVLSLDCEFSVVEGPFARRKFWHSFTVSGGKVDDKGASIGWNISKRMFRGMIDSALGLDPADASDAAKAKRHLRGLADLSGITFIAKILVEQSDNPEYPDRNRLDRPVLPNEKEWRAVMDGQDVPARPSRPRKPSGSQQAPAQQPAWNRGPAPAAPGGAAPAWQQSAPAATTAPATAPAQQQPATAAQGPAGPAWLNG